MKKLIQGIIDFRKHRLAEYREKFSKLALGQSPDALFITCSDSRVVPNLFASTDPGDLFVIRNVGNFIPPCNSDGHSEGDRSEWAAIEFSILQLHVSDMIVCGHSECGAIQAILQGLQKVSGSHLQSWLQYGENAPSMLTGIEFSSEPLAQHNKISQANVLLQLEHLKTYPLIQKRIQMGRLHLHGWWFDIGSGDVYSFNKSTQRFNLIAE
ncbi:MAG: carbonic anhydrase [Deltaproteobacteria bacterium]|nr:carbonic anhydrase [Deltaproteobacteria bacterium]